DPRVAFYLSESLGIEGFYTLTSNSANNTFDALKGTGTTVSPVIREVKSQYGALLHWVPWYAKINVFNKILYFDWYLAAGAGTLQTVAITNSFTTPTSLSQSLFSLYAATGHQYHLTRSFTVRLDFSGAYYKAPLFGTTGSETWFSNYNFVAGIGLRI
ncbi:MAG: outer membrane beta-barrel domain-containing protein, partial [Bdellovibrionota bacterium]